MNKKLSTILLATSLLPLSIFATSGTWNVNGSGNWNTAANWSPAAVPGGTAGDTVNLTFPLTLSAATITLNTNRTPGILNIGTSLFSYTLSGGSTLTLNNNAANAQINQVSGSNSNIISVTSNIRLRSSLDINNQSSNSLSISSNIQGDINAAFIIQNLSSGTGAVNLSGNITNGGAGRTIGFTQNSSGSTMTLSGTNSNTGITTITAGTLSVSSINNGGVNGNLGAATNAAGNIVFGGGTLQYTGATASTNRSFTINNGSTGTFEITTNALTISGSAAATTGTLIKTGAGTLIFPNANSHSGGTTLSDGTLIAGNNGSLGSGTLTINAGTLAASGAVTPLTFSNSSIINGDFILGQAATNTAAITLSGNMDLGGSVRQITVNNPSDTISGIVSNGGLTKAGTGTLTFSNNGNSYTDATTISNGTLALSGSGSIATSSSLNLSTASSIFDISGTTSGATVNNLTGVTNSSVTLGTSKTLTINNTSDTSFAGIISDTSTGSIIKSGANKLTLSGTNTYTGITTINAGTLSISTINNGGVAGNLGAATNAAGNIVFGGGTLQYTGATASTDRSFTINNGSTGTFEITTNALTISGSAPATTGILIKTGAGTLIFPNANSHSGGTTLSAGTLIAGNNGSLGSGTLTINAGTLAASGAVTPLTFSNTSTINGDFTLGQAATNTAAITLSGNMDLGGSARQITVDNPSDTISGIVSNGGLTKAGTGTLILSGPNTYTGITTINVGTLNVSTINNGGVAGNLGAATNAAGNIVFGGGTLQYTGATASTDRSFTINNGSTGTFEINTNALTISGAAAATTGNLIKTGAGTLIFTNPNLHSGITTISNGTLALSSSGAIANSSSLNLSSASSIFDISGITSEAMVNNLTGVSSSSITLGTSKTLTTNNNSDTTFAGIISDTSNGSLTKTGVNALTLSGANSYTGTTTLSAGTLITGNNNALGSSSVNINAGTLAALSSSSFTLSNNIIINGDFILGQAAINTGALTLSGTINLGNSTRQITVNNPSDTISGVISNGGINKVGTGTLILSNSGNTYTGTTTISNGTLALSGSGSIANSSSLNLSTASSVFNISGTTSGATVNNLTGVASSSITLGTSKTLTTNNTSDTTFAGIISDISGGALTKTGGNKLTLSGTNTYTGVTTISNGILSVATINNGGVAGNLGAASANSANIFFDGGTLQYTGINSSTDRGFTINSGKTASIEITTNILTISGSVPSTNGGLNKLGAGTLTLYGTNAYTGVTTISNGILSVASINNGGVAGNLGAASSAVSNIVFDGGTLQYTGGNASTDRGFTINIGKTAAFDITTNILTISGSFSPTTSGLTKTGSGTIVFTTPLSYNGQTAITGGTLALAGSGSISSSSLLSLSSGTAFDISALSGTGTSISAINDDPNSFIVLGSKNLTTGDSTNTVFAGTISGASGSLTKVGSGKLTLSGNNTYTGPTRLSAGTLSISSISNGGFPSNIGQSTNAATNLVFDGGTLQYTGGIASTDRNFTIIDGQTANIDITNTLTISGISTNTVGSLNKVGVGTLDLEGVNLHTGTTTISSGTLALSSAGSISNSSSLIMPNIGVVFDISGLTTVGTTVNNITSISGTSITLGSKNLTAYNNSDTIFAGTISGASGSLTSTGPNKLTLSGSNSYTGATTITAGTLSINSIANGGSNSSIGASSSAATNLVFNGGTLQYSGQLIFEFKNNVSLFVVGDTEFRDKFFGAYGSITVRYDF